MKVEFTRRALADLLAQVDWLSQLSPRAARGARHAIQGALERVAVFPLAAPLVDDAHRDVAVRFGRDGFFVRYRVLQDRIVVVRVFHARQLR